MITLVTFIPLIIAYEENALLLAGITSIFGCFLPLAMVEMLLKLDLIKDFYALRKRYQIYSVPLD